MTASCASADQDFLEAFDNARRWLNASGGKTALVAGSGREVVASRPLVAGEPLLRVPWACLIRPAAGPDHLSHNARLALSVLRDCPPVYQATLPPGLPDIPAFFDSRRASGLVGTSIPELVQRRLANTAHAWEQVRANTLPEVEPLTWARAVALVDSRAFRDGGTVALVPLLDLLDTSLSPNVRWSFGPDGVTAWATRPIGAGGKLLNDYGAKSNLRLMLSYGFALPNNPHDECLVRVGTRRLRLGRTVDPRLITQGLREACARRLEALPATSADTCTRHLIEGKRSILEAWLAASPAAASLRGSGSRRGFR